MLGPADFGLTIEKRASLYWWMTTKKTENRAADDQLIASWIKSWKMFRLRGISSTKIFKNFNKSNLRYKCNHSLAATVCCRIQINDISFWNFQVLNLSQNLFEKTTLGLESKLWTITFSAYQVQHYKMCLKLVLLTSRRYISLLLFYWKFPFIPTPFETFEIFPNRNFLS